MIWMLGKPFRLKRFVYSCFVLTYQCPFMFFPNFASVLSIVYDFRLGTVIS